MRRLNLQSFGAKSLGKANDIDWSQGDAGQPPVLFHFLNAYHVIETVNPNQMGKVGFQTNGSFQLHGRKQKPSVARDRDHFFAGTDQTGCNRPRQTDAKCLLPVRHQNLPSAKTVKIPS